MTAQQKQIARGYITVVQEGRFRLVADAGQGYLFTLGTRTAASAGDLRRWRDAHTAVVVEYDGRPNMAGAVARAVRPV